MNSIAPKLRDIRCPNGNRLIANHWLDYYAPSGSQDVLVRLSGSQILQQLSRVTGIPFPRSINRIRFRPRRRVSPFHLFPHYYNYQSNIRFVISISHSFPLSLYFYTNSDARYAAGQRIGVLPRPRCAHTSNQRVSTRTSPSDPSQRTTVAGSKFAKSSQSTCFTRYIITFTAQAVNRNSTFDGPGWRRKSSTRKQTYTRVLLSSHPLPSKQYDS